MKQVGAFYCFGLCSVVAVGCALPDITADYVGKAERGGASGAAGQGAPGGATSAVGTAGSNSLATAGRLNAAGATNVEVTTSAGTTSNGGGTSNGGALDVAGAPSDGGTPATVGTADVGGAPSSGGNGGAADPGGAAGMAGAWTNVGGAGTGGATSKGGASGIGGAATGGAATGGVTTTAGAATGGAANCTISNVAYPGGFVNTSNRCLACQPGNSSTAWSLLADGTSCAGGQVCLSGTCQSGCWIGAAYYVAGVVNQANKCETCQPGVSTTTWTLLSEGASCASGQVCHSGTCQSGCWIGAAYYSTGTVNQANKCQTCQPGVSTTTWTSLSEGAACASGQVCHGGTCQSGCWIGATYYTADAANPSGLCRSCKPGVSTTSWTSDAAACGCTGTLQIVQDSTGLCVAKMATIPASTNYSINVTEVTRTQYSTWLATTTAATLSGQDATNCGWNTTFTPDATCMGITTYVCQGTACGNHPQVCVDWCDAYTYCAGVGKRLCGKIGGGPNLYADYATASASQWYNACSSAGMKAYPYGSTYSTTTCNGLEYWGGGTYKTLAVGSLTGCQAASPYSGAYDLSGNVREWEDSCSGTGQSADCRLRGGSFNADIDYQACGFYHYATRVSVNATFGFRCCSP